MGKNVNKVPLQHKGRVRRLYAKDKFLEELDSKDWTISSTSSMNRNEKIKMLKALVNKLTTNLQDGLDAICPLVTLNRRNKAEPWLQEEAVKLQKEVERVAWSNWKENSQDETLKIRFQVEKKKTKKIIEEKKSMRIRQTIIQEGCDSDKSL